MNYYYLTIFNIINIFQILALIIPLLIGVAAMTLLERKLLASVQGRKGPNKIGFIGILQPLADGLKLFLKEFIIPYSSNKIIFLIAPFLTFWISLLNWAIIPFKLNFVYADISLGVLYLLTISSLGVYGIIIAGWASNSKYALLGALRSTAQMISYEVSIGLIIMNIILLNSSLNLNYVILAQKYIWYLIPLYLIFILFIVSALAETNRAPFDLPEAEAELVAGYNIEFSGMSFALFFLGEYSNILLMSILIVFFFLGGYFFFFFFSTLILSIKIILAAHIFIIVRAGVPRLRYDQLMELGWKRLLPLALSHLIVLVSFIMVTHGFLSFNN